MSDGEMGPFWLGPNWVYEPLASSADGMRLWRVIREDADSAKPVGYVRELPARPRESSRFVAESLGGERLGPERPTGPNHSLDDIKRHLGDR